MRRRHRMQSIRRFYNQAKTCLRCLERLDMNHLENIKELNANLARLYADALELPELVACKLYHFDRDYSLLPSD